jgi:hypothetical protein
MRTVTGKITTMRVLVGLSRPDDGPAQLLGEPSRLAAGCSLGSAWPSVAPRSSRTSVAVATWNSPGGRAGGRVAGAGLPPRSGRAWNPMGEDPNRRGASRRWIITAVEHSLRRLQTDYIDLYQYHRPDTETDLEERSSTASTRSSRPAATSAASTWPTTRPPSSSRP